MDVSPDNTGTIQIEHYVNGTWKVEEYDEEYPEQFSCFSLNSKMRFTAQPKAGYKFKKWQGNDWDGDGDLDLPSGFNSNPDEFYLTHNGTLIMAVFERLVNPTVNAGEDTEAAVNTSVTLQGSVTNPSQLPLNYQWTQQSGLSVKNLTNATTLTPSFTTPDSETTIVFVLTAKNKNTAEVYDTDDIIIEVKTPVWYKDKDKDKYSDGTSVKAVQRPSGIYYLASKLTATSGDCNDDDASIHPGATEICGDGKDQDCNGSDLACTEAPSTPTGLAANAVSSKKIVLRWTDSSSVEAGFKIERKKNGCSSPEEWAEIQSVGRNINTYNDVEVEPDTQYSYRVIAYNSVGDSGYSKCSSTRTSVKGSPNAPVNLDAYSYSASQVELTWNQSSSTITKFEIYRKAGSGEWSLIASTKPDILTYKDKKATGNQTSDSYCYYVRACNDSGCSPPTYSAWVPFNPSNLTATRGAGNKIILTWTDNSDNEKGFEVYRKEGNCSSGESWELIKTAGANKTSLSDTNVEPGTTYSYKVRAYYRSMGLPYAYGHSKWSNCDAVTTP